MTMTGPQKYPGASTAYWWQSSQDWDRMETNAIVWHSTEGTSLPNYGNGSAAPNLTAVPDFSAKRLVWYQHFDFDASARALENRSGGVETNTLNVCQVELVGTCDPSRHEEWGSTDHLYMPELPDWAIRDLAAFAKWAHDKHGVPLTSGQTFKAYPGSAGTDNGVRMSFSEWNRFKGHCGHEHVPENCVHPDTLILCADLTWKRAGDLQVGDEIVSFDEETAKIGDADGGRRYRRGVVTRNEPGTKDSYRITTTDGEVIASSDHPWLVRLPDVNQGSRIAWVASKDLDPLKHRVISIGRPWVAEDTRIAGWMAGVLDADGQAFAGGRHGSRVGSGQVDGAGLDLLLPPAAQMWEGAAVDKTTGDTAVLKVEHVGSQPIASLSTDTHTYIADGLLCHNTHGDPGAFPMARILEEAKTSDGPAIPKYEPFPGAAWFKREPRSAVITAMGKRLVAEGCGRYEDGPGPQWTDADRKSYAAWQRKCGFSGSDADGWPGPTTWDKLKVPNV